MESIVVKVSGSLLYPPSKDYLRRLADTIRRLSESYRVAVVAGGGGLARQLIEAARGVGAGQGVLDLLGIEAARLNARLVSLVLGGLAPVEPPYTPPSILEAASRYRVVVLGGLQPGQSTNAVSLVVAELLGARLVVNLLRDTQGVYKRFPPGPGEEPARCLSYGELRGIVGGYSQRAGEYELIDHLALSIAERSGIRIVFAEGSDPSVVERAVRGEPVGTLVGPSSACLEGSG